MIKQIAHLAFIVSNMEASLDFYVNKLGFKKAFEINDKDGTPWIVYIKVSENQFIELFYPYDKETKTKTHIGYNHLCFEVDDIHNLANSLKEKGVPIDVDVIMGEDNNYQFWTHDPDDNPIEFMQYGDNSLQKK